ncbi:hypothetical protein RA210_U80151 [Rubrivivax sp. A210]|nr:hypothetical protein RA210_U80151 [Rubrivivax sp. A210]
MHAGTQAAVSRPATATAQVADEEGSCTRSTDSAAWHSICNGLRTPRPLDGFLDGAPEPLKSPLPFDTARWGAGQAMPTGPHAHGCQRPAGACRSGTWPGRRP